MTWHRRIGHTRPLHHKILFLFPPSYVTGVTGCLGILSDLRWGLFLPNTIMLINSCFGDLRPPDPLCLTYPVHALLPGCCVQGHPSPLGCSCHTPFRQDVFVFEREITREGGNVRVGVGFACGATDMDNFVLIPGIDCHFSTSWSSYDFICVTLMTDVRHNRKGAPKNQLRDSTGRGGAKVRWILLGWPPLMLRLRNLWGTFSKKFKFVLLIVGLTGCCLTSEQVLILPRCGVEIPTPQPF